LAPAPARNAVSLGRVCVDDVVTRRVVVANEGELAFEAEWRVGLKNPRLAASPEFFSVAPGERKACVLSYRPTKTETLRDGDAVLKIVNGRSYAFVLEADARKPALVFSARDVVFGDALVDRFGEARYEPPTLAASAAVRDARDSSNARRREPRVDVDQLGHRARHGGLHVRPGRFIRERSRRVRVRSDSTGRFDIFQRRRARARRVVRFRRAVPPALGARVRDVCAV
jgi:hypothetical protein